MVERIQPSETPKLRNYVLTFRTVNGEVLAWCIRTSAMAEEIPRLIESAANEWLLSPKGRKFIHDEQLSEWGFDNANVLEEVPYETLSKFNIFPWVPIDGVIKVDPDENLLPDELRE